MSCMSIPYRIYIKYTLVRWDMKEKCPPLWARGGEKTDSWELKKNFCVVVWLYLLSFIMCDQLVFWWCEKNTERWRERHNGSAPIRIIWWFFWFKAFRIASHTFPKPFCWTPSYYISLWGTLKGFYSLKTDSIQRVMLKNWYELSWLHWKCFSN